MNLRDLRKYIIESLEEIERRKAKTNYNSFLWRTPTRKELNCIYMNLLDIRKLIKRTLEIKVRRKKAKRNYTNFSFAYSDEKN